MSIVIVQWESVGGKPLGYVAHLRFKQKKYDIDMSNTNKGLLYRLIEAHVMRALWQQKNSAKG